MNKYTRLSFEEREEMSRGIWAEEFFAEIARRINRHTGNNKYKWCYRAEKAQRKAVSLRKQGRCSKKMDSNLRLKEYLYLRCPTPTCYLKIIV